MTDPAPRPAAGPQPIGGTGESPLLTMRGVGKAFGPTVALDDVALSLQRGEVRALIGENGAGKSTLVKILAGAIRPDAGEMSLGGVPFRPSGPLGARRAGIAMIYQELNIAPHLTVAENILLGGERHTAGWLRTGGQMERVRGALARLQRPDIRPEASASTLRPAARQLVEIARALVQEARVLVMDEPTSSLGAADIDHLFTVIDGLSAEGIGIIYISHFLEEVRRVADTFTVLRDGRVTGEGRTADVTLDELVTRMIGRRLEEMFPKVPHERGEAILELGELGGERLPVDASLTLHRGEIVGIAGLVGSGRTELLRVLFGLDPIRQGSVRLATFAGRKLDPHRSLLGGMGLASEDRKEEGLAVDRSIAENTTLSRLGGLHRLGFIRLGAERRTVWNWMKRLSIKARDPGAPVRSLSGGNQQKVALARLLHHGVEVFLLDEPTRGIDVGSKAQIYRLIGELATAEKAILVVSSSMTELIGVCDRIAVMRRGRLGPFRPVDEWDEHALTVSAVGGEGARV